MVAVSVEAVLGVIRASRPDLRNPHDRIAFAVHASFLAVGYSLAATGARVHSGLVTIDQEVGIEGWNELDSSYAFRYFTDAKDFCKVVDVRCTCIGEQLMIDAAAAISENQDLQPAHAEVKVTDYSKAENSGGNYAQLYKDLEGLVKLVSKKILSQFISQPKRQDSAGLSARSRGVNETGGNSKSANLDNLYPRVPRVGESDIMPSIGAGIFDSRRDTGFESGEAGNIVGPHHPLWGRQGIDSMRTDFPDGGIPIQPPGARFDPFGPPGVPGLDPLTFGARGRGPPGRPHPDLHHFPPL